MDWGSIIRKPCGTQEGHPLSCTVTGNRPRYQRQRSDGSLLYELTRVLCHYPNFLSVAPSRWLGDDANDRCSDCRVIVEASL